MIVVCSDIYQDVTDHSIESYFASLGLRHLHFLWHSQTNTPATYNQNVSHTSIDGVWASTNLSLVRGGYLDFDNFPGDHPLCGSTCQLPNYLVVTCLLSGNLRHIIFSCVILESSLATTWCLQPNSYCMIYQTDWSTSRLLLTVANQLQNKNKPTTKLMQKQPQQWFMLSLNGKNWECGQYSSLK